jgi:diketogulonate reductase-like aldo/keto reductase
MEPTTLLLSIFGTATGIAKEILTELLARHDLSESVVKEINAKHKALQEVALRWLVAHPVDTTTPPADDFDVQPKSSDSTGSGS